MTELYDEDALVAAVDVIGRANAKDFEVGYLDDDVPADQARWWAAARWQGVRVHVENHRGPSEAAEALAKKLLHGGACVHCGGRIHLGGAPRALRRHGRVCAWKRQGRRWERGCADRVPEGQRRIPTPAKRGVLPPRWV